MKKIVLSIAASMLVSLCAVQAQQQKTDTTGTAKSKTQQQNRQKYGQTQQQRDQSQQQRGQSRQQQSDRYQNHDAYGNEGMVVIEKDKIPSSLKQTLQDQKYAGWENATIYHNSTTGEYVIAPKAYRFDKQGKEVEMKDSEAYGNREGRQGRYSNDQSQYPSRTDQTQTDQSKKDETGEIPTSSSRNQSGNTNQSDNQSSETNTDQDQAQRDNGQQQPSSSYRTDKNTQENSNAQSSQGQSSQEQYRTEGMVEVQAEQIPASLRRTLSESQYRGWENGGKLYQDPSTSEYVLVMDQTTDSSQPRSYRFDKNGQMKDDESGTSKNKQ